MGLSRLARVLQRTNKHLEETRQLRGRIGRAATDGSGGYTIEVPDMPGWVYVRLVQGGVVTETIARNSRVPRLADLPVRLDRTPGGDLYIIGGDLDEQSSFTGDIPINLDSPPHTHRLGFGMEDVVEGRRIQPGLVHAFTVLGVYGLEVYIEPFHYITNGARKFWGGGSIDLTSFLPGSANTWRWVLVGINPATNLPTAVSGTALSLLSPLATADLAAIAFSDKIPLAGVKLRNGQTAINEERDFADCRTAFAASAATSNDSLLWLSM